MMRRRKSDDVVVGGFFFFVAFFCGSLTRIIYIIYDGGVSSLVSLRERRERERERERVEILENAIIFN